MKPARGASRQAVAPVLALPRKYLDVHDVGRDGDTAWFAMEFVDGQTLPTTSSPRA